MPLSQPTPNNSSRSVVHCAIPQAVQDSDAQGAANPPHLGSIQSKLLEQIGPASNDAPPDENTWSPVLPPTSFSPPDGLPPMAATLEDPPLA